MGRNWLWFIPTVVGLPTCLCLGCCGGFFYFVTGAIRSSEPYGMALEAVNEDPVVVGRLGEPIEESGYMPMGSINVSNGDGVAHFVIKVAGPDGEATVTCDATKANGVWEVDYLHVLFSDGTAHQMIGPEMWDGSGLEGPIEVEEVEEDSEVMEDSGEGEDDDPFADPTDTTTEEP
jgi:hypothetical protein